MWVNYLINSPFAKEKDHEGKGLGIPVDLSLAFHTDAGTTPGDSIIGTLAIYSTAADNGKFRTELPGWQAGIFRILFRHKL